MNRAYDVIIVGGGPAGSTAGYLLSRSGFKVLLIDKSTFPRHKLCGGCITDKTVKLLERVFGVTADDLKKNGVINFESSRYEIFRKDKLLSKRDSPAPFYFVERHRYDNFFLRKAQQAGTEVIEGERCTSLDISGSKVTTSTGRMFEAKVIIGADGFNSTVRQSFTGFDQRKWNENLAVALEIFVNRSDVKKQIDCPTLYFDFIEFGYAWIFPNKDRLTIGICGLNKINKKTIFRSFNNFLTAVGFRDLENLKSYGYYVPYGNFLLKPVCKNALLLGDAAGFADPLLGEGVFFSQRSAELASQVIKDAFENYNNAEGFHAYIETQYVDALQKNIYEEFTYANKIRNVIFLYLSKFRYYPLKIAMDMFGDKAIEAIHGIRSYRWLRKLQ
jgi:geranylgeranyl reductase family protein